MMLVSLETWPPGQGELLLKRLGPALSSPLSLAILLITCAVYLFFLGSPWEPSRLWRRCVFPRFAGLCTALSSALDLALFLFTCAVYLVSPESVLKFMRPRRRRVYPKSIELTNNPTMSGLLMRLPTEVRLEIFKLVAGGRLIHLLGDHDSLEWRECTSRNNVIAWYHPCWNIGQQRRAGLRSLLLANRHIYSEASEVLYGSNTFHFLRPSCFLGFLGALPASSARSFRSFKLYFDPAMTEEIEPYARMWETLSSLPRLQELRILFAPSIMTKEVWKKNESALLEPVKGFKRKMAVFDVYLSVFPDWISDNYVKDCHIKPIKQMEQLSGAHLSRYASRAVA